MNDLGAAVDAASPDPMPGAEPALEWTVNPWRQRPLAAGVALLAPFGLVALAASAALPPLVLAGLGIAVLVALRAALFVARCHVGPEGIGVRRAGVQERLPWSRIRRARVEAAWLWASTESRTSWRSAFRGLGLALPAAPAERDRLLPELKRRLALHGL
jgi:hypothetical protein